MKRNYETKAGQTSLKGLFLNLNQVSKKRVNFTDLLMFTTNLYPLYGHLKPPASATFALLRSTRVPTA